MLELGDRAALFGDRLKDKYNAMFPAPWEKQAKGNYGHGETVDLLQTGASGKEAHRKGKMSKS